MCNFNFTDAHIPLATEESPVPTTEALPDYNLNLYVWLVSGILFVLFAAFFLFFITWRLKPKKNDVENGQHSIQSPADYSLDKLKLCSLIGKMIQIIMSRIYRFLIKIVVFCLKH